MLDLKAIDAALGSPNENTRWQAAIALGEQCENAPEAIWPLTVKWGSCDKDDVRAAIATCVLEHLLENHFEPYFVKTAALIYMGSPHFANTFAGCWKLGQANRAGNAKRWDDLHRFLAAQEAARQNIADKKAAYERKRQTRQSQEKTKSGTERVR